MRNPALCICENKDTDQLRVDRKADHRLCFRYIDSIQFLYLLNTKFHASSHLLWMYNTVCVIPCRKPRRLVFSQQGSYSSRKTKVRPGEVLMVKEEKALVKVAAEAPEQFDNWETVATEAERVADWIKHAKHCVAFTGKVFWSML